MANAFPSVSRQAVLDAVTEHAPALLPMACVAPPACSRTPQATGSSCGATPGRAELPGPFFAVASAAPLRSSRGTLAHLESARVQPGGCGGSVVIGAYLDDVPLGSPRLRRRGCGARRIGLRLGRASSQQKTRCGFPRDSALAAARLGGRPGAFGFAERRRAPRRLLRHLANSVQRWGLPALWPPSWKKPSPATAPSPTRSWRPRLMRTGTGAACRGEPGSSACALCRGSCTCSGRSPRTPRPPSRQEPTSSR